jgi:hypothetical protein
MYILQVLKPISKMHRIRWRWIVNLLKMLIRDNILAVRAFALVPP